MSYVRASTRPTFLVRSRNNAVSIVIEEAGAAVTPSAATYTLRNGAGTAVVSAATATAGSASTYTITADLTGYDYASDWTEEWALTISGTVYLFGGLVVLCRAQPFAPMTENELIAAHSDLSRSNMLPTGVTSWQGYIDRAMDSAIARLMRTTTPPHQVVEWSAFRDWMEYRALWNVARDLMVIEGGDGKWTRLEELYRELADAEWERLGFRIDRNEDGVPDSAGEDMGGPNLYATGIAGRGW